MNNSNNSNNLKSLNNTRKLTLSGVLCAVAVVGSLISFPMFGSKCAPVQHMVNIIAAVFLGPAYGVGIAFSASLIRNLLGLGSLLAFPGSMIGALLCALIYKKTGNLIFTCIAEMLGTGILGGLCAYPLALAFLGQTAGSVAFYAYIIPFLISTSVGSLLSGIMIFMFQKRTVIAKH